MSQQELDTILAALRDGAGPSTDFSVENARDTWFAYSDDYVVPADLTMHRETVGGRDLEWLYRHEADLSMVVLYLHGGGFVAGGIESHRPMTAEVALTFDGAVVTLDYRRTPEFPLPAQIEDALAAYRHLLALGTAPGRIAIAGDSAGGGLAIATLLAIVDVGLPRPGAGWVVSPWTDLTNSGASIKANAATDTICYETSFEATRAIYVRDTPLTARYASPGRQDLTGLPPLLIQVATTEILLDDSFALARQAAAAHIPVTLESWAGVAHVWHLFSRDFEEARAACANATRFLHRTLRPA